MVLPNGTGKTTRVLVFARGAKAEEAKAAEQTLLVKMTLLQNQRRLVGLRRSYRYTRHDGSC